MSKRLCLSLFCGLGGGSMGFVEAGWDTVGIDVDDAALADYRMMTGHDAHNLDLATASPEDLRRCCPSPPDVILTSPPCQAFSGCLPIATSRTAHYQALSTLAERGLMLALEAWPEAPPRLILLENVPRIQSRGREWLDAIASMLNAYGYAWRETTHDCAELGGLAQHRRRFLGVARLVRCDDAPAREVGELLYEPPRQQPQPLSSVILDLPLPGPFGDGGAMHTLPQLSAMNWLRLACIPQGRDWRALPERVYLETGEVDPRSQCERREGSMGVTSMESQTHAVIGAASIQNTALQVADTRLNYRAARQNGGYGVNALDAAGHAVLATSQVGVSWASHADPRLGCSPRSGAYGVARMTEASHTVVGAACHDNSAVSVADERWPEPTHELVMREGRLTLVGPPVDLESRRPTLLVIRALDGTWHRPMTTLELAALQTLPVRQDDGWLELEGRSHKDWRKRIGNAIPSMTAYAIAQTMTRTLDAADANTFLMSATPRWVAPPMEHVNG